MQGLAHSMNSLMAQASPFAGMARVPELSQTLSPRALNGLGSGLASGLGSGQLDGPGRLHINPSNGLVGGDSHMLGMADLQVCIEDFWLSLLSQGWEVVLLGSVFHSFLWSRETSATV